MYGTIELADTYFSGRLYTRAWDQATSANRTKALTQASSLINLLPLSGVKTDASQSDAFPRNGDTSVPDPVLHAAYEIALALLDGVDVEKEADGLFITRQQMGSVSTSYNVQNGSLHKAYGIPSVTAWRLLMPYLVDLNGISIHRVS